MRFSERIGQTPPRTAIQIDDIDDPLKNRLWTLAYNRMFTGGFNYSPVGGPGRPTGDLPSLRAPLKTIEEFTGR
jgi:hypothetical protein